MLTIPVCLFGNPLPFLLRSSWSRHCCFRVLKENLRVNFKRNLGQNIKFVRDFGQMQKSKTFPIKGNCWVCCWLARVSMLIGKPRKTTLLCTIPAKSTLHVSMTTFIFSSSCCRAQRDHRRTPESNTLIFPLYVTLRRQELWACALTGTVQAKWIQRDLSFDCSEVSERCRKTSKQTNTIAPRRNVSTNILACRSNLSWRGLVGRRPLTVMPKEKPQTQQQKQATKKLKVPPRFINGSGQSTRGQPLPFKRKWLFTIKQLYFLLFCCVLVGDPSTIKVDSP